MSVTTGWMQYVLCMNVTAYVLLDISVCRRLPGNSSCGLISYNVDHYYSLIFLLLIMRNNIFIPK